ncbi:MAG: PAS domain S-box protein, partial [Nitrospirota bacterium]
MQENKSNLEELYEATKNQLQRLSIFHELYKAITSALDLDKLLKSVTEEATRLLNARICILRLLKDGKLKVRSASRLPEGIKERMELESGDGIAGCVIKNDKPLLVEDVSKMPENLRTQVPDVKSVICVPLKVGEGISGTLCLYDKEGPDGTIIPFNMDDLDTAEDFASISALAIEKAWIYEKGLQREKDALEAKKRMEILFETVQSGIVTLDRDYRILYANRSIEQWIDKRVEETIGKYCSEVFYEDGGICPHCVAEVTFETGEINAVTQMKGSDYAGLTSYPIKDENGNVVESVVFIRNITEKVRSQEEILGLYKEVSETKDYLKSLIDNSADAIVTSDLNGIITSWNKGAEEIYGLTEREAIGKFLPFIPDSII